MDISKQQNEKYYYISVLNVLSAIAVVVLHANGSFWNYRNDYTWAINNLIECVFYFAVPIFFMLAGATLLDYTDKYDTKTFFKKRLSKTVIPFLFWSIFALFIKVLHNPKQFLKNEIAIDKLFNGIFNTEYLHVFWFFIPLFCVYLSIPLFANLNKEKKINLLWYLACVAFLFNILIPFGIKVANAVFGWEIQWKFEISVLSGYLFYTIIGYLLHKCSISPKIRIAIYSTALIGLIIHFVGTYLLSQKHEEINDFFKGYTNLPCVLYSVGIFVFVKSFVEKSKNNKLLELVCWIQGYTFEIYLMHMFVYEPVSYLFKKMHIANTSLLFVLLMTVILIPTCIIITIILRKIPLLKKIVP